MFGIGKDILRPPFHPGLGTTALTTSTKISCVSHPGFRLQASQSISPIGARMLTCKEGRGMWICNSVEWINYTGFDKSQQKKLLACFTQKVLRHTDLDVCLVTKEKYILSLSYRVTNLVCPNFFFLLLSCPHCAGNRLIGQPGPRSLV